MKLGVGGEVLRSYRAVLNRIGFAERLAAELAFAFRHGTPLGVLLLLPEGLRPGDHAGRRAFAARLDALVRVEDVVAPFDDRSWTILVHGIPASGLRQMAERLCALLLERPQPPAAGPRTVVSIGIAVAERSASESPQTLLERACVALERARATGGGRVKA